MKRCLVIGYAKSGKAAALLLNKKGYAVDLTDMKEIADKEELEKIGIHVYDNGHPAALYTKEYEFVVKNPGIKYTAPLIDFFVKNQVKIYTEIEIASWYLKNSHYGAITGTNGKTTITTMLYEILQVNHHAKAAGNIGTPLCEIALEDEAGQHDIALELSNFQLLGVESFKPDVAVVCNLAPDHLDYMNSVEEYYESKFRIAMNQTENDWFLRNVDDELVMKYTKGIKAELIDFSLIRQDVDLYLKDGIVYFRNEELFDVASLNVVGRHNIANAMVAACMALKLGVSPKDIQKALAGFKGIEHRIEFVRELSKVRYYNDSKGTNTQATTIALASFDKNIILLAGGHDKGISFEELKQYDSRVKCCISFGETREKIAEMFTHSFCVETMFEALEKAKEIAKEGDVVLLSPACSSYDQFANYEQRGELFKEAVWKLN